MDRAALLAEAGRAPTAGDIPGAGDTLRGRYAFAPLPVQPRRYGLIESSAVYLRDGFIDRSSSDRLLFPGALRLLSHFLPEDFPYHPNWRTDLTHPACWQLTATLDHLVPVSRGGAEEASNWVTISMLRNSAKGNWTIQVSNDRGN